MEIVVYIINKLLPMVVNVCDIVVNIPVNFLDILSFFYPFCREFLRFIQNFCIYYLSSSCFFFMDKPVKHVSIYQYFITFCLSQECYFSLAYIILGV